MFHTSGLENYECSHSKAKSCSVYEIYHALIYGASALSSQFDTHVQHKKCLCVVLLREKQSRLQKLNSLVWHRPNILTTQKYQQVSACLEPASSNKTLAPSLWVTLLTLTFYWHRVKYMAKYCYNLKLKNPQAQWPEGQSRIHLLTIITDNSVKVITQTNRQDQFFSSDRKVVNLITRRESEVDRDVYHWTIT